MTHLISVLSMVPRTHFLFMHFHIPKILFKVFFFLFMRIFTQKKTMHSARLKTKFKNQKKGDFAYGDEGQNYKNLVQLMKSFNLSYLETAIFGCPASS